MKIRSKKEIEENKLKKQKVFKILKRILDIIVYLWALILTIGLIVGSCSKKNNGSTNLQLRKMNDINNSALTVGGLDLSDYKYMYSMKYSEGDIVEFSERQMALYMNRFGYSDIEYPSPQPSVFRYFTFTDYEVYIYENKVFYPVQQIRFQLICENEIDAQPSYYKFQLNTIEFYYNGAFRYGVKPDDFLENPVVYSFEVQKWNLFTTNEATNPNDIFTEGFLDYWCITQELNLSNFQFNNQINYNSPFDLTLGNQFIKGNYNSMITKSYNLPYFVSGGVIYNQIVLKYDTASAMYFNVNDNVILGPSGSITYFAMFYQNSFTNVSTMVNVRDNADYYHDGGYSLIQLPSSTWVSQEYRNISFLYDITDSDLLNVSQFNNNSAYSTSVTNGNIGLGNVFDLLSNSFNSLLGLFNISIIPGVTIGVLMFLPLVVTIIVLVFKAVKK